MARGLQWMATHPLEAAGVFVGSAMVLAALDVIGRWRWSRARQQLLANQQRWKAQHRG